MSSRTIILNSSNVVPNTNNTKYTYKFPQQQTFKDCEMGIARLNIYYSWVNINASLYNNNKFYYKWFDNSGNLTQTYEVNVPDGFYSIDALSYYLQSVMDLRLHFVNYTPNTSTATTRLYYITFQENPNVYGIQLNVKPVPAFNNGTVYTVPVGGGWRLPTLTQCPQLGIYNPELSMFGALIGFDTGIYPPNAVSTNYQHTSNITPVITPVSSIIMKSSVVFNEMSNPTDMLYSFAVGDTAYGNAIVSNPNNIDYCKMRDGIYNSFDIKFVDQNENEMIIKDPQLLIVINIRTVKK